MVAKINRGVSLYGAVIYNQRKVDESTARIITGNRMITDITGNPHNVMQQTLWLSTATLPPTGTRRSRYCISP